MPPVLPSKEWIKVRDAGFLTMDRGWKWRFEWVSSDLVAMENRHGAIFQFKMGPSRLLRVTEEEMNEKTRRLSPAPDHAALPAKPGRAPRERSPRRHAPGESARVASSWVAHTVPPEKE